MPYRVRGKADARQGDRLQQSLAGRNIQSVGVGDGREGEEDGEVRGGQAEHLGKELGLHLEVGTLCMTCVWDRWGKRTGREYSLQVLHSQAGAAGAAVCKPVWPNLTPPPADYVQDLVWGDR